MLLIHATIRFQWTKYKRCWNLKRPPNLKLGIYGSELKEVCVFSYAMESKTSPESAELQPTQPQINWKITFFLTVMVVEKCWAVWLLGTTIKLVHWFGLTQSIVSQVRTRFSMSVFTLTQLKLCWISMR